MSTKRTVIIRCILLSVGITVGLAGLILISPFLGESETYTHPKKAFFMSVFFIFLANTQVELTIYRVMARESLLASMRDFSYL